MKILHKLVSSILIFILLTISLPIEIISKSIAADTKVAIKTVDLTDIVTGTDMAHSHIYEKKYNTDTHWEECFICHNKINAKAHNLRTTDYSWGYQTCYPGNSYTKYCSDGCGYQTTMKDPCLSDNQYKNTPLRYLHYQNCQHCGVWMNTQGCIDANGKRLNCQNLGTCVICGYTYTEEVHHVTNNGKCEFCGKQFAELIETNVSYASDNSYAILTWRIRGVNGGVLTGQGNWYTPTPTASKTYTATKNAENDYTFHLKLGFKSNVQIGNQANVDSNDMLVVNGKKVHFGGWQLIAYQDRQAPTPKSITVEGNGSTGNFSRKATITAKVTETFSDTVEMRLLAADRKTVLINWGAATENANIFTRVFDLSIEVTDNTTVYVEARDKMGNTSIQSTQIRNMDTKAPTLVSQDGNTTNWATAKTITYQVREEGSGEVQIAFNNQNDFALADVKGNNIYTRGYKFVGDVYGSITGALYLKDKVGNTRTEKVTISNIDNTAPTITNITQNLNQDKKSCNIVIQANDINTTLQKSGSGVAGYQITTNNTAPTNFQTSNTFTINKNGTYYVWVKDNVGLVTSRQIKVANLEIDVTGSITWNDQNNQYNSRIANKIRIYRKTATTQEELIQEQTIQPGQQSYTLKTRECDNNGTKYEFIVRNDNMPGYETTINGKNITNNLILPTFTGSLEMSTINSYENQYLKNARVKIEGNIKQNSNNPGSVGIHQAVVTLPIDSNIQIDSDTIHITINGEEKAYTIQQNTITIQWEETSANDTLAIYLEGTLKEIAQYHNQLTMQGKLKSTRAEKTNIDLGQVLQVTKDIEVQHQLPEANIQIIKKDSITKENLTDAQFTLYEWNGNEYQEIEIIIDDNQDGIYTSKIYRWNSTTQGKYKIVESKLPQYHTDLGFQMEYRIDQLAEQNYTITVDYDNENYQIAYNIREPDQFTRQNGVVENEPWKIKAQIQNIDQETKNEIQANAEFTLYEWNQETSQYEESDVKIQRQENKIYHTNNWLYYTNKNQGKYRIIQTKAPEGYYGDYDENKQKRTYDINLVEWIQSEQGQNEGTITIKNAEKFENRRTKGTINLQIVDDQTKKNPQADAKLQGAIYGIYAYEPIYHADGVTTRYQEPGLLYQKDELIAKQTTNSVGKTFLNNIECGTYYVKMLEAPEGYQPSQTKYKVEMQYQEEGTAHQYVDGTIEIAVKKQAFQLQKIQEEEKPLPGAGFSIYQVSQLSIVKEGKIERKTANTYLLKDKEAKQDKNLTKKANQDGTYELVDLINYYYKIRQEEENQEEMPGDEFVYHPYNLTKEQTIKNYEENQEGQNIQELKTDENGYIQSPRLAYAEYIVIETSVPRKQDTAEPFLVQIQENNEEPQELRIILDPNFRSNIKLYVKDADTKQTIRNNQSKYVIRNCNNNELQTYQVWTEEKGTIEMGTEENPFVVGKEGYLIIPMRLGVGEYRIEQITTPMGYAKNWNEKKEQEHISVKIRSNTAYYEDKTTGEYVTVVNQYNEPTKVQIDTIDQETKEKVTGIQLEIRDEQGKTVAISSKEGEQNGQYFIQRLPVGKYKIIQTQIPYEKGYVVKQEKELIVEDIKEWQKTILEQEQSKVILKVVDQETKELLDNVKIELYQKEPRKLVATTEQTEQENVKQLKKTDQGYYIKGLPIGEYEIVEVVPEGYKQIETQKLEIKDVSGIQTTTIENRKLIFAMEINKQVEEIRVNGKKLNIVNNQLPKIDIKSQDIKTQDIQIQYVIQVENTGEIEGTIGTIKDIMPEGMEYLETETGIWQVNKNIATCERYKDTILQPGQNQKVRITLKWKNSTNNMGKKENKAYLEGSSNKYNYPNSAGSTNGGTQIGESQITVLIGIRTGEDDLKTIITISILVLAIVAILLIFLIKRKTHE